MPREKRLNTLSNCKKCLFPLIYLIFASLLSACQPSGLSPNERWQHANEGAYTAQISDDASLSVVSSLHHGMSLWDLNRNALKYTWYQQQDSADNLVLLTDISADNEYVMSASKENFALWNTKTGQSAGYWKIRNSSIRDIAVSNEGKHLLIGKGNGTVVHVTLATGRRLEFLGHKNTEYSIEDGIPAAGYKVNSVDMLPNGRIAISGANDYIAYVWDTLSGQVIYHFNHPSRITKVALDSQARYAFTADSKKSAYIWDLKTGKLVSKLQHGKRQAVFSTVRFSKDGTLLLTGAPSSAVNLWQVTTGERITDWRVSPKEGSRPTGSVVHSVAFRDNSQILTESSSGYAELWQLSL
jgi:WD40 repeat protein